MRFCLLWVLLLGLPLAAEINKNHDFQTWATSSLTKKLRPHLHLFLQGEMRYGDDASQLYLYYVETSLNYAPCRWLEWAPGYRQQATFRPLEKEWVSLYIPLFNVTLTAQVKGWEIKNRHRVQYFILEEEPHYWLYRQRWIFTSPWKLGKMRFNPYVLEEVFFVERRGFAENRLALGGTIPLTKEATSSILYMLRSQKDLYQWLQHHILWLRLDFSF